MEKKKKFFQHHRAAVPYVRVRVEIRPYITDKPSSRKQQ
jgi:hypothetical protein